MEYKKHVDKTHIGGELPYFVRSDVTVMIWLTNPSEYEGGHFSLEDSTAHTRYKLNSGDAVIYPSNIPNAIEPVTSGENLIISTWIQSHISDPIDREILFDLETVSQRLYKSEGKTNLHDILFKAFQNLLRQKVGF
jgi:PKHD-type hydroxylase